MSNVEVANALDLLGVSNQSGDLPPEFLELFDADDHSDFLLLRRLDLNDDLGPKDLAEIVC